MSLSEQQIQELDDTLDNLSDTQLSQANIKDTDWVKGQARTSQQNAGVRQAFQSAQQKGFVTQS
jgi:hypothetical protein